MFQRAGSGLVCESPWSWHEFGWWRGKELHTCHCCISSHARDQVRVTSLPCRRQHPCLLSLQFSLTRCPTYRDVFLRPSTQQDGLVILLYSGSSSTWSALQLFVFPVFLLCSLPWLLHNRSDTASCSQSFKCRSMPFDSTSLNKSK